MTWPVLFVCWELVTSGSIGLTTAIIEDFPFYCLLPWMIGTHLYDVIWVIALMKFLMQDASILHDWIDERESFRKIKRNIRINCLVVMKFLRRFATRWKADEIETFSKYVPILGLSNRKLRTGSKSKFRRKLVRLNIRTKNKRRCRKPKTGRPSRRHFKNKSKRRRKFIFVA